MSNLTFLTQEQCFESEKLDILQKRGIKAAMTDFAILLGGWIGKKHIDGDESLEGRTGYYWTKTDDGESYARVVCEDGDGLYYSVILRDGGARPALPFSSISSIPTNGESGKRARDAYKWTVLKNH